LSAKATDNDGNTTISAAISITVDVLPTVSITAPPNNSMFTPPATVNLAAEASDSDGSIAKVEFYRGATLIATDTSGPYQATDSGLAAGSYTYNAKAYDNLGGTTTSAPVNVTVGATKPIYFIHTDHLNTPRLITNSAGQAVWSWANDEPFGNNAPNENPSGLGTFSCNLRFAGQYFDKETNPLQLLRDYDPAIDAMFRAIRLASRRNQRVSR
jgi:hypothetical protein